MPGRRTSLAGRRGVFTEPKNKKEALITELDLMKAIYKRGGENEPRSNKHLLLQNGVFRQVPQGHGKCCLQDWVNLFAFGFDCSWNTLKKAVKLFIFLLNAKKLLDTVNELAFLTNIMHESHEFH